MNFKEKMKKQSGDSRRPHMLASSLTCIDMHNIHTYKQNKANIIKPTHNNVSWVNARVFQKLCLQIFVFSA